MKTKLFILCVFLGLIAAPRARAQCAVFTPNLNLGTPTVGQTSGWGTCLNTDLTTLDGILGGVYTLTPNATSPSIAGHSNWLTANTSGTVLANFTGGFQGQALRILCNDVFTTMVSGPTLSLSSPFACAVSTQTSITLVLSGTVWREVARASAAAGGGGSPGGAAGALQFNNGTFGGAQFIYNPADMSNLICVAPCATIQTQVNSGFQLLSPSGNNFVTMSVQDGNIFSGSINVGGLVTSPGFLNISQGAEPMIGGNTLGGSCFASINIGSSPPCATAFLGQPGDVGTEVINGQDLVSFASGPLLNKGAGFTVNTLAGFIALTPVMQTSGGSLVPATEHTVNTFGFYCLDQGGYSTTEQACIKGTSQTTPGSGSKFFIDAAVGSGKNFLGDGVQLGNVTGSTQCLQADTSGNVAGSTAPCPFGVGFDSQAGKTTAQTPKTIFTVGASNTLFEANAAVACDSTSASATVLVTVLYTDVSNTAQSQATSTATCTTLGTASVNSESFSFMAKAGTVIQYSTTIANTPTYDVRVQVQQLGAN